MKAHFASSLFKLERLDSIIQLDIVFLFFAVSFLSWVFWRLALRSISQKRTLRLKSLYRNLLIHFLCFTICLTGYSVLANTFPSEAVVSVIRIYLGVVTIFWGAVIAIKIQRIIVLQYLFFMHLSEGVPALIVNITTLVLALSTFGWLLTEIFDIRVMPVLATSALFSLILGLALQDTLGNLFAGVAMQFDKPYLLGDWIEVNTGQQKILGQVLEITWRATKLQALTDEEITIPNRVVGQAEISNFSVKTRPVIRSQLFRADPAIPIEHVKKTLLSALKDVSRIKTFPAPNVLILETHESWLPYKVIYFLDDFGAQWAIADEVVTRCIDALKKEGIAIAGPRLKIEQRT